MNRQSIHQQIESLLKIIQDQHNQIKKRESSAPQVEIDFMIQNMRQLYEASLLLNHTNAMSSLDEVKSAVVQKILAEKKAIELKQPEPKKESSKEEVVPQPTAIQSLVAPKPMAEPVKEVVIEPAIPLQEKTKEPRTIAVKSKKASDFNSSMFEDKPTLGDKFGNGETLHVKIASKNGSKTLAEKLHHHPIKDLKQAIGINEKFLFINQLFDGNLQQYSEAIDKVNSLNNLESAREFITTELAVRLNWDDSNEHVQNFMELVERRFI